MRKEQRTEERVIRDTRTVYIADDGKEFEGYKAEEECKYYERKLALKEFEKAVLPLRIDKYDGLLPITNWDEWRDCDAYWYKIENKSHYDIVEKYYETQGIETYFKEPSSYPAIMCVVECDGYADGYYLDKLIEITKTYFAELGFAVTINGKE